ncbi:hypothetical protein ACHAXR_008273 [Thalassiosira sp. AJA248-18]
MAMLNLPSSNDIVRYSLPSDSLNRAKGLRKLGVSEDDVHLAVKLLDQIPACPSDPNKAERILGYASSRLARAKALRLLGATEEEVDLENAKMLGSLGVAGRRRSFSMVHPPSHAEMLALSKAMPKAKRSSMMAKLQRYSGSGNFRQMRRHTLNTVKRRRSSIDKQRRSSDSEIRRLRNNAKSSANEIKALKARIDELEKRLTGTAI